MWTGTTRMFSGRLSSFLDNISRGIALRGVPGLPFRFPVRLSHYFHSMIPSSSFNYHAEAGDLWMNSTVRAGLQYQIDTFAEAEYICQRRRPDRFGKWLSVDNHPLVRIMNDPNPWYDGETLYAGIVISLRIDGNAYAYIMKDSGGRPAGLVYLPHHLVTPVSLDPYELVTHYEYQSPTSGPVMLPFESVLHIRQGIDPRNPIRGLSSLGAHLRQICTENEAATYSASILRNMGIPGVIITPKNPNSVFNTKSVEELKRRYRESVTGENRGDVIVPNMAIEVHKLGSTVEELALDKMFHIPSNQILSSMNLDPLVLGLPSSNRGSYANMKEARRSSYESCIIPLNHRIDRQITRKLIPMMVGMGGCFLPDGSPTRVDSGDRLMRDYSNVLALMEDKDRLVHRAVEAFNGYIIKRRTALEWLGEDYDPVKDDVYRSDIVTFRQTVERSDDGVSASPSDIVLVSGESDSEDVES